MMAPSLIIPLDCGGSCGPGTQNLTGARCDLSVSQGVTYKSLCCPLGATPDPSGCTWRAGDIIDGFCNGACNSGELLMAESSWAVVDGSDKHCFTGQADYCCDTVETGDEVCGWNHVCVHLDKSGNPVESNACPMDRKFVTYARGVPGAYCSEDDDTWLPFCCNDEVDGSSCHWAGSGGAPHFCDDNKSCGNGGVNLGFASQGGGSDCEFESAGTTISSGWPVIVSKSLCCNGNALSITTNNLPVPLANLFPKPGPSSDKQDWNVDIDSTMGGESDPNQSNDPNQNSFGWYIMSGPSDEITSLDKRDGSHWEVFDCEEERHEGKQKAKMICMNETEDSNCDVIYMGRGVAETVVEMPAQCGPGKYAMAVSLMPSKNQDLPSQFDKRGLENPVVYDFTFDYDFTPLQRRADSNVLFRVDYSDDPGYWDTIVGRY